MTTAELETVAQEALARYLPIIDEMITGPCPATDFEDGTGYGSPTHVVRVLRTSQDFWDDEYHKALQQADAEMSAALDALATALTVRWGDPLVVDLWSYLTAGYEGRRGPELIERLSQNAGSLQAWPVPDAGRWIGLTVGQHDTELPLELTAVVSHTPLPAASAADTY
ncbi:MULTISPECIES: hypothetical protein [unclassified Streptomyces]|uniref:hypothetical protein n=1 Tax=unclassified Streptomyces TaxID=2593676 RepID=UPI002E13781F|nr:hypothetical protein OG457_01605 [Streptomyces sp. NBC_01207]